MRQEQGLTIIELLISIVVTAMLTGLIFTFFFGYFRQGVTTQVELNAIVERLNAADYLRENIGSSSGFINQNSIPDPNTMKADPAYPSGEYWELIHSYAGLKNNTGGITPVAYFKRFSVDGNRKILSNNLLPYEDEYIIYLDEISKEMRVRVLANGSAPGNALKTSCPPAIATDACPTDRILATDVTGVNMRYFNKGGSEITYSVTSVTDTDADPDVTYDVYGPDFPSVEVVEFNLKLSKVPSFDRDDSIKSSTIIRVALRNS